MIQTRIKATKVEAATLIERMSEAQLAERRALEVFTMFCEGRGVPGATFVAVEGSEVVVQVPDIQPETQAA